MLPDNQRGQISPQIPQTSGVERNLVQFIEGPSNHPGTRLKLIKDGLRVRFFFRRARDGLDRPTKDRHALATGVLLYEYATKVREAKVGILKQHLSSHDHSEAGVVRHSVYSLGFGYCNCCYSCYNCYRCFPAVTHVSG